MTGLPDFYNPLQVGTLYIPHTAEVIDAAQTIRVPPAHQDQQKVMLLLVDPQVDFIHEDGALSVPGAVDDTCRTIEWIFHNLSQITSIAASLDSHIPTQIFFSSWWINEAGEHPAPFTPITGEDVNKGIWRPLFEEQWSLSYIYKLENNAKKELMIWPYHTMIGTPGHIVTPALYEVIAYHSAARQSQPAFLHKGSIPKTEHYSLLEPEVKVPEDPQGDLNVEFLSLLNEYDLIYVAGQAKSHCVLETVSSVMRHFHNQPEQIARWRVLTDCMSSVAHPSIDFDAAANAILGKYAEQGLQLVTSADPIG